MNKWIIRGLLLALLLASVNLGEFVRTRAGRGVDIDSAVKHLLTHVRHVLSGNEGFAR